jgi:hypothetical protein
VDASDLKAGDRLLTKDSQSAEIKNTEYSYEPKKVYNFEVADWHTYFVGMWAWLVHNALNCMSAAMKQLKYAAQYGIDSYKNLRKLVKGTGLEVHHLIEKRFASIFKPPKKARDMASVVLTPDEHQIFTNAWRNKFPYGRPKPTANEVNEFAREVYKDYPELLKVLDL